MKTICGMYLESASPSSIVASRSVNDEVIGFASLRWVGEKDTSHPGFYIAQVVVDRRNQHQGHGYSMVSELCQKHLDANPTEPLWLTRPHDPTNERDFAGGFGFLPVDEMFHWYRVSSPGSVLYKADPPDPSWTRN